MKRTMTLVLIRIRKCKRSERFQADSLRLKTAAIAVKPVIATATSATVWSISGLSNKMILACLVRLQKANRHRTNLLLEVGEHLPNLAYRSPVTGGRRYSEALLHPTGQLRATNTIRRE